MLQQAGHSPAKVIETLEGVTFPPVPCDRDSAEQLLAHGIMTMPCPQHGGLPGGAQETLVPDHPISVHRKDFNSETEHSTKTKEGTSSA